MKGVLKCLEVGVLLTENDSEFDSYNQVYQRDSSDVTYGYYDEDKIAYKEENIDEAIDEARKYVENGVDMTYAIVTNQGVCHYDSDDLSDVEIEDFTFEADDVEYCVAKINGEIIENWI